MTANFPLKYTDNISKYNTDCTILIYYVICMYIDLDKRRLLHLANVLEDDLKIENEHRIKWVSPFVDVEYVYDSIVYLLFYLYYAQAR